MKKNITAFVFALTALTLFTACGKDKKAHPCKGCPKEQQETVTTSKEHNEKEDYSI